MTTKTNNTTHTLFADVDIAAQPRGIYEVKEVKRTGAERNLKFVKLARDIWFLLLDNGAIEYGNNEMKELYHSFRFTGEL